MPTAYAAQRGYRPAADTPRFLFLGLLWLLPYAALLRRYGKAIRVAKTLRIKKKRRKNATSLSLKSTDLHKMQRRIFHGIVVLVVLVVIRIVVNI